MTIYASYVICTSPRSGSTLLCKLLAATGVAGKPGSYFHDGSISAWLGYYDLTPDVAALEKDILADVFNAAIAEGSAGTGLFGLRLQRHSFDFFMQKLRVLHPKPATDAKRLEAAFGRTAFIHLTRRDKVEQAVSYVKAEQTGLWHAAPDGTELERLSPPQAPAYAPDKIAAQVEKMTAFDQQWESWFESQGLSPLVITYEALSADPVGTLKRVLEHLGRNPQAAGGVKPGVAKLADEMSKDWVTRFRAEKGRGVLSGK